MKAGHKHQIAFAGPKEANVLETCVIQALVRNMGAVNNLSQLVEKFNGADNGVVSLLAFLPPSQSVEHWLQRLLHGDSRRGFIVILLSTGWFWWTQDRENEILKFY